VDGLTYISSPKARDLLNMLHHSGKFFVAQMSGNNAPNVITGLLLVQWSRKILI
jgi:hypothetical protein